MAPLFDLDINDLSESAWFLWVYMILAFFFLRFYFRAMNRLDSALNAISANITTYTPQSAPRKHHPPPKPTCLRDAPPRDTPPDDRERTTPDHSYLLHGTIDVPAHRKPKPEEPRLTPTWIIWANEWRTPKVAECPTPTPLCTPEEYRASVERLSSALRAAAAEPFVVPAAFRKVPEPPLSLLYGRDFPTPEPFNPPKYNGPGPLTPLPPLPPPGRPVAPVPFRRPQPPPLLPSLPPIGSRKVAGEGFAGPSLLASGVRQQRLTSRGPTQRWFL